MKKTIPPERRPKAHPKRVVKAPPVAGNDSHCQCRVSARAYQCAVASVRDQFETPKGGFPQTAKALPYPRHQFVAAALVSRTDSGCVLGPNRDVGNGSHPDVVVFFLRRGTCCLVRKCALRCSCAGRLVRTACRCWVACVRPLQQVAAGGTVRPSISVYVSVCVCAFLK